jgi:hypothetical protein
MIKTTGRKNLEGGKEGLKNYGSSFPSCCSVRYRSWLLRALFAATHVPEYAAASHPIEVRKNLLSECLDSFTG